LQGLTAPATECKKLSASKAPDPGRHHVGTPGDIMSEHPGDFVGIRMGSSNIPAGVPVADGHSLPRCRHLKDHTECDDCLLDPRLISIFL
jgi:hypothetical protein